MEEAPQKFRLRWEHHRPTVLSVCSTLLENGKLVDVTLAAEGKRLKAHRLVLSACSPYFELLLSDEYDKHPILILKDAKFQELEAVVDFMYKGEVDISEDQVAEFLKLAEALQIKGLDEFVTNKKRGNDDEECSGTMSPGSQKKQRLKCNLDNGDASSNTQSVTQDIPSTTLSVNITMETDMPNIIETSIETEPKILTQHEDNLMNDRASFNLRKKSKLGRFISNVARDEVFLTANEVVDTRKNSNDMKIFIGKKAYKIKMTNHQIFI